MICQCGTPMVLTERWTPETCCGPAVELTMVCPGCSAHAVNPGTTINRQPDPPPASLMRT